MSENPLQAEVWKRDFRDGLDRQTKQIDKLLEDLQEDCRHSMKNDFCPVCGQRLFPFGLFLFGICVAVVGLGFVIVTGWVW